MRMALNTLIRIDVFSFFVRLRAEAYIALFLILYFSVFILFRAVYTVTVWVPHSSMSFARSWPLQAGCPMDEAIPAEVSVYLSVQDSHSRVQEIFPLLVVVVVVLAIDRIPGVGLHCDDQAVQHEDRHAAQTEIT